MSDADESLHAQIHAYRAQLDGLIRRGRALHDSLAACSSSGSAPGAARATAIAATRIWQHDCAAMVNQLSGLSKAHWLARAYSEAFLLRSTGGRVAEEVEVSEIVERILRVLEQAVASMSRMDGTVAASSRAAPSPRRFEFVHNAKLRPILEQAYADSRRALEQRRFGMALMASCSVLEAIITDALEHNRAAASTADALDGTIADWSFGRRIAVAERAGLIRRGCARLPTAARKYRDFSDAEGELGPDVAVSERDARLAGQVLHVVMKDLDPGR